MKNRIKMMAGIVLFALVCSFALSERAVYGAADLSKVEYYISESTGEAAVYMCHPDENGLAVIPASINGTPVTDIHYLTRAVDTTVTEYRLDGESQFFTVVDGVVFSKDMTKLVWYPPGSQRTSYTVPDTVTVIGKQAFCSASALRQVVLPSGLQQTDESAFRECGLENVSLPEGIKNVGTCAFSGLNIEELTIPGTVTTMGMSAFENNKKLKRLVIKEGVKSISKTAFVGCDALESVILPEKSLKTIGEFAFKYGTMIGLEDGEMSRLSYFAVPESVTAIGDMAFGRYYKKDSSTGNALKVSKKGFVVYGVPGSVAQNYANNNGLEFKPLSEKPDGPNAGYVPGQEGSGSEDPVVDPGANGGAVSDPAGSEGDDPSVIPDLPQPQVPETPQGTSVTKVKASKKAFTVSWKKKPGVNGYQIQYALKKNFKGAKKKTVNSAGAGSAVIKKLKRGKKYYVRVRTFEKVDGTTVYSSWSKVKSVRVK